MSNTTATAIVLDKSDKVVAEVLSDLRSSLKSDGRYAAFVAAHPVTRENAKDYAYSLAGMITTPGPVTKDGSRTRFGNAVQTAQKGLVRALGPVEGETTSIVNLLTTAGKSATLEEVTAAWEAAQQA